MQEIEESKEIKEILDFLSSIYPLSKKCRGYIKKVIKRKIVCKKETLLKIGEVNHNLYFIKKGALKCFYYHKGKEVCDWFFFENETVVSFGSFYDQLPSEDCIIALEDVEVYYITKKDYDYLKRTFLEFANIACTLLEKYLKIFHVHARLIRKQSPFEKFQQVMEKMPEYQLRVPGKDLASWL
ncbi:MAG TPA: cyclic nucleotide-binding domain-containing protein, partial [Puia sp.]|nr:cyclic nucleotide-binding domain-containing protein [Puia sp.]